MMDAREYQQYFEAYFEGTLTESQAQNLAECLRQDQALCARFIQEWELCNLLSHADDDTDDSEEFTRSFWERIRAEETAEQFARDFEERKERADSDAGGASSSDLLEAIEEDEHRCAQRAAEQAHEEARARKETIRKAAEQAFERFMAEERRRREEEAHKLYLARRRRMMIGVGSLATLLIVVVLTWLTGLLTPTSAPPAATTPAPVAPPIVARITRSLSAHWLQEGRPTQSGTPLTPSSMFLTQGLVELTFDGGTQVILQAPADLRLEEDDQMFLGGGSISATIAEGSSGFIVRTPSGTVVDYGTEFGVAVNSDGETEAFVYQGKIGLRSGSDPVRIGDSKLLIAGQAGRVDQAGKITETAFHANHTIREIPRYDGFAISGKRLSLADVVGGGSGFETGYWGSALDVLTGEQVPEFYYPTGNGTRWTDPPRDDYPYVAVPNHEYIDGVFVPITQNGTITVTSAGHSITLDFQPVNTRFGTGIGNWFPPPEGKRRVNPILNGRLYGIPSRPAIMMKRNKGITFDLAAIRKALPGVKVVAFTALCGISEADRVPGNKAKASFYVLTDGVVRFVQSDLTPASGGVPIRVDLNDEDRFLTLITAFSVVGAPRNHSVFAVPALELVSTRGSAEQVSPEETNTQ